MPINSREKLDETIISTPFRAPVRSIQPPIFWEQSILEPRSSEQQITDLTDIHQ